MLYCMKCGIICKVKLGIKSIIYKILIILNINIPARTKRIGKWNGGVTFYFRGNKINVEVGKYSYGLVHVYAYTNQCDVWIRIGNYTSISEIKIIIGGHHHMDITTYPMKATFKKDPADGFSAKGIIIGNDVWIGRDVIILDGVKIGNGAIIGAGAVVAKDVPDYAVVVGNPAKIIKYRFNQEEIKKLLDSKWWELDKEDIENIISLFYSKDVDKFVKEIENIKNNKNHKGIA